MLHQIPFFQSSPIHILTASKGNPFKIFIFIILLPSLLPPFFPNHPPPLILTPILLPILPTLPFHKKPIFPFIIPTPFIPHTTSLPLILTNLLNILSP
ncbi:ArsB/NhaD family transporter, partial [Staphylococcus capitis]|uniref:ArsB/NhaD family transporter n=1 Tax=Staphylococcus capitis TaxID=29388 RepID=UPI0037048543